MTGWIWCGDGDGVTGCYLKFFGSDPMWVLSRNGRWEAVTIHDRTLAWGDSPKEAAMFLSRLLYHEARRPGVARMRREARQGSEGSPVYWLKQAALRRQWLATTKRNRGRIDTHVLRLFSKQHRECLQRAKALRS